MSAIPENIDTEDPKLAVAWDSLKSLLASYENVLQGYKNMALGIQRGKFQDRHKIELVSSFSGFYLMISGHFNIYLMKLETWKPEDYSIRVLAADSVDDLLKKIELACQWAQTQGPFATIYKKSGDIIL